MDELNEQIDLDRKILGKKPFDRDDDPPSGGGTVTKVVSITDPDSGQQTREGKPDGFHYSEHRTVDLKNNVIVNIHYQSRAFSRWTGGVVLLNPFSVGSMVSWTAMRRITTTTWPLDDLPSFF